MSNAEVFGWKISKFINNSNYNFSREKILDVCGKDNVNDAFKVISSGKIIIQHLFLKLNKLSKKLNLKIFFIKMSQKDFI